MGAPQQGGELPLALPTATISTGGVVMPVAAAVPIRPVGLRINASCGPAAGGNQPAGVFDYVADGPTPDSQLSSPEDEDEGEEGSSTCWKKNVWTQEEDAHLLSLIKGFAGKVKWSVVGSAIEGRSGKQCRERWHNHLSPEVSKTGWTPAEDRAIVEAVHLYGTRWSEIVKMFPGRTDNAIKNRWNSMQRKEQRRQKRLKEEAADAAMGGGGGLGDGQGVRRRRRIVQQSDMRPADALAAPVPFGNEPAAGSALLQLAGEVSLPQIKPGGRRKRAVQARVDVDAASLLLTAVSKIQSDCRAGVVLSAAPSSQSQLACNTESMPAPGGPVAPATWAKFSGSAGTSADVATTAAVLAAAAVAPQEPPAAGVLPAAGGSATLPASCATAAAPSPPEHGEKENCGARPSSACSSNGCSPMPYRALSPMRSASPNMPRPPTAFQPLCAPAIAEHGDGSGIECPQPSRPACA